MKFIILAIVSMITVSAQAKSLFACFEYHRDSGYSISILINPNSATVLQASPQQAKVPPVYFTTVESPFTVPVGNPVFQCSEKYDSGIKVNIKVYNDKIQILQQSKNGRYAPLQYNVLSAKVIRH